MIIGVKGVKMLVIGGKFTKFFGNFGKIVMLQLF